MPPPVQVPASGSVAKPFSVSVGATLFAVMVKVRSALRPLALVTTTLTLNEPSSVGTNVNRPVFGSMLAPFGNRPVAASASE